ncbi:FAD dependent oxidoreductase [Sarocladium strictum]
MQSPPKSVLIIGSGVFGLTTADALTQRAGFENTTVTIVDDTNGTGRFPPTDAASVDSSRIIRADYSDSAYSSLAAEAQLQWRQQGDHQLGGEGRYCETGFVLTANDTGKRADGQKTGLDYVRGSWKNVVDVTKAAGLPDDRIRVLESREALQKEMKTTGYPGDWGYLNTYSGWADAGRSMEWFSAQVQAKGKVNFVDAKVRELVTEGRKVVGAKLSDGKVLRADWVMVAAGAWCSDLVDLRGRVEATGHVLGYLDITPEEQKELGKRPVVLNLTTGLFIITPCNNVLKIARHGYGYLNPETITTALPVSPNHKKEPIVASRPCTARDDASNIMPQEADQLFRRGLRDLVHCHGIETRPWKDARVCWYSDTRDADWLVDWHGGGWENLFIATGDSGHAFKFLPVLGDKVVDAMLGKAGVLGKKWRWKEIEDERVGRVVDGTFVGLITEDGSRGGRPGMLLKEEFARLSTKL